MTEQEKKDEVKNPVVSVGLDCGTMNLVCARSDSDKVSLMRNVFLKIDKETVNINQLSNVSYVENEDGELFIIGNDAFDFANLFNREVSRPMEKGLISPKEISAIDVLTIMIKQLIGETKNKDVYVSYSIPAEPIDEERSVIYHQNVFARILKSLGANYSPVNEAMAIVYSECSNEKYSGIGISFGAGMMNCCVSLKGIEALKFSTSRSGDWIDNQVAKDLDMVKNRVTNIKEKYMKLTGAVDVQNKKTKRVLEALYYYYKALIDYTVKKIIKEFNEKVDVELSEPIPIVISGGTSTPDGFVDLFKTILSNYELPFEVSEVRASKNSLTTVANGLLIKTMADAKRI